MCLFLIWSIQLFCPVCRLIAEVWIVNAQKTHIYRNNAYRAGTELFWFNIVKNMDADALAPYLDRTSEPMILNM